MGATIDALNDSRVALRTRPSLVVYVTLASLVMAVAGLLVGVAGLVVPLLPQLLFGIVVVPIGLAAIVGMVYAGVSGERPLAGARKAVGE